MSFWSGTVTIILLSISEKSTKDLSVLGTTLGTGDKNDHGTQTRFLSEEGRLKIWVFSLHF